VVDGWGRSVSHPSGRHDRHAPSAGCAGHAHHRGKFATLSAQQRRWLKRRQAIEPAIGHAKADHRMDRCWLQGASGDAIHAVLCAAGFNIRWLLRAIAAKGLQALFLALIKGLSWGRHFGRQLRWAHAGDGHVVAGPALGVSELAVPACRAAE